jgi:hypothetical protein
MFCGQMVMRRSKENVSATACLDQDVEAKEGDKKTRHRREMYMNLNSDFLSYFYGILLLFI